MKQIMIVFATAILLIACKEQDKKTTLNNTSKSDTTQNAVAGNANANNADMTTIEWLDPVNTDLGKLVKDQSIEVSFRFKNTGTKNLIIQNVSASCGCTIPEKPEKPFAPGEEGVIKAKFNGSGSGHISKQIHVLANTTPQSEYNLTFEGEIKE